MRDGDSMDAERARRLLASERQRIERGLAELRERAASRELTADDQPSSDQGSDLTERAYEAGSAEDLTGQLQALERAEKRLEQGTYGRSVESGETIPDVRLEANPLAERTVDEEIRRERG
jgi:DnaK suppressor protein